MLKNTVSVFVFLVSLVCAASEPVKLEKPSRIEEIDALKAENIMLRWERLQAQIKVMQMEEKSIQAERDAFNLSLKKKYLTKDADQFDWGNRKVVRK